MSQTTAQPPLASLRNTAPILRVRGLAKTYVMGDTPLQVLKGVDLSVRHGEFLAIEGRSGSGKSTLLHIMGALDTADEGAVEFNGVDYSSSDSSRPGKKPWLRRLSAWALWGWILSIPVNVAFIAASVLIFGVDAEWSRGFWITSMALRATGSLFLAAWFALLIARAIVHHQHEAPLTKLRNEQFGFVFQFYHLLPELNVIENTLLGPMIDNSWWAWRTRRKAHYDRAAEVLKQLGMEHRMRHRPNQLSGGERQRVAIARALMNQPKVLFADEPTGNLDAETGRQIMTVLEGLHRERGQTIVMVTHDRQIARTADRVLVLKDGRLASSDPT
jgi:lipoprotein-releasing system ATP-binding protein